MVDDSEGSTSRTREVVFDWRTSQHYSVNSMMNKASGKSETARSFCSSSCIDIDSSVLSANATNSRDLSNGKTTDFAWQHDARWHPNNTHPLFNNAAHSTKDPDEENHGMMICLDVDAREATLLAAYYHPQQMKAVSQGNLQLLDNDSRALVGWGHNAAFTQFSSDGQVLCNVHFGASVFFGFGRAVSYRVFEGDWVGRPQTAPDAEVIGNWIYVSWKRATEVAAWQLETWLSGELDDAAFKVMAQYEKTGFETEIDIPENLNSPLFRLAGLDANGNVLDVTELLQRQRGSPMERLLNMHYWILGIAFVMSGVGLFLGFCRCCGLDPRLRRWRYRSSEYQMVAFSDTDTDRQSV